MRGGCIALRCSGLGVSCPDAGGALGAALRFELSLCRDWQKGSHELEQRVLYANFVPRQLELKENEKVALKNEIAF